MTGQRRWYVLGLVVAVLVLVGSVAAAVTLLGVGTAPWGPPARAEGGWEAEVGPAMMGRGGMMGAGDEEDELSAEEAASVARGWVDANRPGASVGDPVGMMMGYLFTVTEGDRTVGTIMVNEHTGQVTWLDAGGMLPDAAT